MIRRIAVITLGELLLNPFTLCGGPRSQHVPDQVKKKWDKSMSAE
ncbi:hypothetical protein [Gracilibacillus alcaliphilus]|nr:hypothetical protein [Gracilibacillus alcaliphilus]MBM7675183.1 hypothetical protein [Gracilibacillus alcaliphilus]